MIVSGIRFGFMQVCGVPFQNPGAWLLIIPGQCMVVFSAVTFMHFIISSWSLQGFQKNDDLSVHYTLSEKSLTPNQTAGTNIFNPLHVSAR